MVTVADQEEESRSSLLLYKVGSSQAGSHAIKLQHFLLRFLLSTRPCFSASSAILADL